jgi:hypothetical protein
MNNVAISCLVDLPARPRPCLFLYLATIGPKASVIGQLQPLVGRFNIKTVQISRISYVYPLKLLAFWTSFGCLLNQVSIFFFYAFILLSKITGSKDYIYALKRLIDRVFNGIIGLIMVPSSLCCPK